MKVEIKSSGAVGGIDTTLLLDGLDVSRHCTGISLGIDVGEPITLTATFIVKDLSIVLEDVEPQLTADEVSKEIHTWMKAQAIQKAVNG